MVVGAHCLHHAADEPAYGSDRGQRRRPVYLHPILDLNLVKLSIVIPCYNEEGILPLTLERLNKLSNEWISRDDLTEIEFVFVDDGSQDRT